MRFRQRAYARPANYNVTAVTDDGGTVLERYAYTPYGEVTFLEADFDLAERKRALIIHVHNAVVSQRIDRQRRQHPSVFQRFGAQRASVAARRAMM